MKHIIKRVAAIHDMSGFGRCSLTVAMPVLSAMGHQCCPLPSAYLSSHTAFQGYTFHDMTGEMLPALEHWKELGVEFDAIYSGFLGSAAQMEIVKKSKEIFPEALLIVDPVMGDHGKPYKTYTPEMCANMTKLAGSADIITPNLTEAAIILGRSFEDAPSDEAQVYEWLKALSSGGERSVVLTGVSLRDGEVGPGWFDVKSGKSGVVSLPFVGMQYHGTGDLYSSVFTGAILNGETFEESVRRAAEFVGSCAALSWKDGTSSSEGVRFESLLGTLARNA